MGLIVAGIDSGTSGAVSFVGSDGRALVFDLPMMEVAMSEGGKPAKKLDARQFARDLRLGFPADSSGVVYIEALHARAATGGSEARSGMSQQGVMMETFGALCAVVRVMRLDLKFVYPQAWKRFYGLTKDKGASLDMARRLYPSAAGYLKRVKDHNRAESLLIAHYGLGREQ